MSRKCLGSVSEVSKGRGGGVLEGRSWAAAYLACTSHLGCISPASRLHLDGISAASRLHLACISPASRLHLDGISAAPRLPPRLELRHARAQPLRLRLRLAQKPLRVDVPVEPPRQRLWPNDSPHPCQTSCRCSSQPPTHGTQLLRLRRRRRLGRTPPLLLHLELPRVELREPARRMSRRVPSLTGAGANRLMRRLGSGSALPLLELGQSRAISGNLG